MNALPAALPDDSPPAGTSRAGRNVPLAIGVGVGMGAAVLASLYVYRPVFVGFVAAAAAYGCYELTNVLRTAAHRRVPLAPLMIGAVASYIAAYQRGTAALAVGVLLTTIAVVAWLLLEGGPRAAVPPDLSAALWVLCYVVLLAGFAVLMVAPDDGHRRVTCYVATVVCSDVGGFATGVLFGRHPMAPTVSPKKSWEGFIGSVVACAVAGTLLVGLLLHGALWQGLVFGLAIACCATLGDLAESLVKRDLGVKDMGTLLPGHGGIMDRLDSLLLSAPVAYLLLTAFVSPG
ncbi:MAG TPA: phosphatidate cytidylyltransferase [Mycobacteriales bacterium]|nr:phosphatidate cytidylyltransferase [Mycobacteriales bacterium]